MKIFNFGGKNLKHFSSELEKLTAFDEMENFNFPIYFMAGQQSS